MVFRSLVVVKQEIMFKKAGPLSGKTEMAAKVTQVEMFLISNKIFALVILTTYA